MPDSDDGYLEEMTRAVFQAGFDWELIRQRWTSFRRAFQEFSVERVAYFGPDDIDRLLRPDSGIVRNYRKILATVHNAAVLLELASEYGSFGGYLRSFDGRGYAALVKDLRKRFKYLGTTGSFVFLYTVGEPVPEWERRHV